MHSFNVAICTLIKCWKMVLPVQVFNGI